MHEELIEIITSVDGVGQDSQAKMLYDPLEAEVDLPRDKLGDHRLDLPTARQSQNIKPADIKVELHEVLLDNIHLLVHHERGHESDFQ